MSNYDVCIIGSGAGAGPVAFTLSSKGYKVIVLEKGPWLKAEDFAKDEIGVCRRNFYTPSLVDEPQVIEERENGVWEAKSNALTGWDFWNGNIVGGSSNLMSGYFHRSKPVDFRLLSEFGSIEGANIVDWPITYNDLESYYTKVELVVGISGKVANHPYLEPRSTSDFPFPSLADHPIAEIFDKACLDLGFNSIKTPRAILSRPHNNRNSCSYSGYCGSYGCMTNAKGSSRAALLNLAIDTGNCEIRAKSHVFFLNTNAQGNVNYIKYYDAQGKENKVDAQIYVIACQAVETCRLLLLSTGKKHENGVGNKYGQVGKNFIFSAGGTGGCEFRRTDFKESVFNGLMSRGLFVSRSVQDWYVINDNDLGRIKGGTIDFLLAHPNPIRRATNLKYDDQDNLLWGEKLKKKLKHHFNNIVPFRFEVFCDWHPNNDCFVSLDPNIKDKWGLPVARIRVGYHTNDLVPSNYLADKAETILKKMGGRNIYSSISGSPPSNLMAGGCRFGENPQNSVLNSECRVHNVENLYIADGSFIPTGGSVPYTWTIYANSFRMADILSSKLKKPL
ncbi:2-methyl-1,2-propanediol dehydrogenase [subsurface metagenome]